MSRRKEFTGRTKAAVFRRENGRCQHCTRNVGPGHEPAEFHHPETCEDGGDNSPDNCVLLCAHCHAYQTHKVEAPAKAEGRRHALKQAGVKKRSRWPLAHPTLKKKVSGEVVRR